MICVTSGFGWLLLKPNRGSRFGGSMMAFSLFAIPGCADSTARASLTQDNFPI
jgi:hypothetical protein